MQDRGGSMTTTITTRRSWNVREGWIALRKWAGQCGSATTRKGQNMKRILDVIIQYGPVVLVLVIALIAYYHAST